MNKEVEEVEVPTKPRTRKELFQSIKSEHKPPKSSFFNFEGGSPEPEEAWFLFIDDYHTRVDDIKKALKEERENICLILYETENHKN